MISDPILRWRAWYTEGRSFRSEDTSWTALPDTGLLVLVGYRATGRVIFDGADWYWWDGEDFQYTPSGDWGTWAPKPDFPCLSCIKQGAGVSDAEYQAVLHEALSGH